MNQYTKWEQIRLIIPKWMWGLGTMGYMGVLYIGMPVMALYGLWRFICR
jgi:hypothetical protein